MNNTDDPLEVEENRGIMFRQLYRLYDLILDAMPDNYRIVVPKPQETPDPSKYYIQVIQMHDDWDASITFKFSAEELGKADLGKAAKDLLEISLETEEAIRKTRE